MDSQQPTTSPYGEQNQAPDGRGYPDLGEECPHRYSPEIEEPHHDHAAQQPDDEASHQPDPIWQTNIFDNIDQPLASDEPADWRELFHLFGNVEPSELKEDSSTLGSDVLLDTDEQEVAEDDLEMASDMAEAFRAHRERGENQRDHLVKIPRLFSPDFIERRIQELCQQEEQDHAVELPPFTLPLQNLQIQHQQQEEDHLVDNPRFAPDPIASPQIQHQQHVQGQGQQLQGWMNGQVKPQAANPNFHTWGFQPAMATPLGQRILITELHGNDGLLTILEKFSTATPTPVLVPTAGVMSLFVQCPHPSIDVQRLQLGGYPVQPSVNRLSGVLIAQKLRLLMLRMLRIMLDTARAYNNFLSADAIEMRINVLNLETQFLAGEFRRIQSFLSNEERALAIPRINVLITAWHFQVGL